MQFPQFPTRSLWRPRSRDVARTAVTGSPATVTPAHAASYTDIDQQDEAASYILISDPASKVESDEKFKYSLIPTCRMDRHVDDERNITEIRLSCAERVLTCKTEEEALKLRDILDAKIVTAQLDPEYAETLIHEPEHQKWRRRYQLPTDDHIKRCECGASSQQVCARAARKLAAERDAARRAETERNDAATRAAAERDAAEKAAAEQEADAKAAAERDADAKAAAQAATERDDATAKAANMKAAAERDKAAKAAAEKPVGMVAADMGDWGANAAADVTEAQPTATDKDAATKAMDQPNAAAKSIPDSNVASKNGAEGDATVTAAADGNAATRTSGEQPVPIGASLNQSGAARVAVNGSAKTGAATAKTTTGSPAPAKVAAAPIVIDLTLDDDDELTPSTLSAPLSPFANRLSTIKSGSAIVSVQTSSAESSSTSANAYIPPHLRTGPSNNVTVTSQSAASTQVSVTSAPAPYLAPHMRDSTNTRTTLKSAFQSHKSVRFNPIERRPSRQTAMMPPSSWLATRMSTRSSTGASSSAAAVTIRPATGPILPVPIAPPPNYDPTGSFRYSNGHNLSKTGYVIKEILGFDLDGRPQYRQ
ncbi:hypothetical protein HDU88_003795 [Geranomyces variabilis]|nr:hypothetical protein HDU88_003795 [Geranomyces variabilis]